MLFPKRILPLRKFQKLFVLSEADEKIISKYIAELAEKNDFLTMNRYIQHGGTSCLTHSIAVAYYSLAFIRRFHITCDERSLVRGALLHDYFLYDWHVASKNNNWHGFTHPGKAFLNASVDYSLNQIEGDIIKRHMFPLTPAIPGYRESAIVCLIDKICSILETFKTKPYVLVRQKLLPVRPLTSLR